MNQEEIQDALLEYAPITGKDLLKGLSGIDEEEPSMPETFFSTLEYLDDRFTLKSESTNRFKSWYQDSWGRYYQGQVDEQGYKDGLGILFKKGRFLVLAMFKEDKWDGPYIQIYYSGDYEEGSCIDSQQDGRCVLTRPDGSKRVQTWEAGKMTDEY